MTEPWGKRRRMRMLVTPASLLLLGAGVLYVDAERTAASPAPLTGDVQDDHQAGHDHDLAMVKASGGAYVARAAVLPTRGWTARADAAAKGHPARNAIDGRRATTWQTPKGARAPHVITLDTRAVRTVSGLRYSPEAGVSARRLGRYTVQVSRDGRRWTKMTGGVFDRSAAVKTVSFRAVDARYVRLSATNAAGAKRAVAVSELALLGGPLDVVLDRTRWTAAADSQATGQAPALAVDGDQTTYWSSVIADEPAPTLPKAFVVDTAAPQRIAALSYTPAQNGPTSGRIGRFEVEVSSDGVGYRSVATGTWDDDATTKTVSFPATTARWVRLRALTEAGGRKEVVAAAEVNLYGPPGGAAPVADPGTRGLWGPVIGLPIVPTTAVLLPNDKVLTMSAAAATDYSIDEGDDRTQISIIDVSQSDGDEPGKREVGNTGHQMFCTGVSVLSDGRVLITGGSTSATSTIFDPRVEDPAKAFSAAPDMVVPRGYQTSVTLSEGGVFTIGGSWSGKYHGVDGVSKNGEVLAPGATAWKALPGTTNESIFTDDGENPTGRPGEPGYDPAGVSYRRDNHAWLFADTGGRVFHAGPSDQMNWFDTSGTGSTTSAGQRLDAGNQMNGNAVMYAEDKILTLGGAPAYGYSDATRDAHTIDISGGYPARPVVARTGSLAKPRGFVNSVVMPDGSVLATGGQSYPVPFTDTTAHLSAELWDPATGRFRTLASEAVPRTYHSFSLLLQDGRVLSGGGGLTPNSEVNHPDVQIFTPPALLTADGTPRARPRVTSPVPASVPAGSTVRLTTDRPVETWAMTRVGTSTHSINSDQRRFELEAARVGTTGTTYDVTVPADRGTSVPGPYLLWALDASGTPSVASWVLVP